MKEAKSKEIKGKEKRIMKKFETPVIEVAKFNVADVITTSGGEWGSNTEDD